MKTTPLESTPNVFHNKRIILEFTHDKRRERNRFIIRNTIEIRAFVISNEYSSTSMPNYATSLWLFANIYVLDDEMHHLIKY